MLTRVVFELVMQIKSAQIENTNLHCGVRVGLFNMCLCSSLRQLKLTGNKILLTKLGKERNHDELRCKTPIEKTRGCVEVVDGWLEEKDRRAKVLKLEVKNYVR